MEFSFKLGKTATETHEMLVRVYGDAAVSRKAVYKWFEHFRGGAESTEDFDKRRKRVENQPNNSRNI
jgi:aminopeptidase N